MKTALLFQDGNFVGREYYHALRKGGCRPDLVIAAGRMKDDSIEREIARTGGQWSPPPIPEDETVHRFGKLSDPALWDLLRERAIDVAIQGGIGILKPEMIAAPRLCFLNVHPGKLPEYRGNSCPEWSLYNGDGVWATAHVIDAGIDTGPVILTRRFDFPDGWDYPTLRANIYGHCAAVLIEALSALDGLEGRPLDAVAKPQDEALAHYWGPIPDDKFEELKRRLVAK